VGALLHGGQRVDDVTELAGVGEAARHVLRIQHIGLIGGVLLSSQSGIDCPCGAKMHA
jgi:hypothetical protein